MKFILWIVIIAVQLYTKRVQCEGLHLHPFKDHLDTNNLRHAIVIQSFLPWKSDTKSLRSNVNNYMEILSFLSLNQYYINFYNLDTNQSDLKFLFPSEFSRVGIFMKFRHHEREEQVYNFLYSASVNEKFNFSYSWFILIEDLTGNLLTIIHSLFDHLNVTLNADITVGIVKGKNTMDLYDLYKICPKCGTPLQVDLKGHWSLPRGLQYLDGYDESFVSRRRNFKNISIDVATTLHDKSPLFHLSDMEYLENYNDFMQNDIMQRKTYQLLKILQPLYNFTFIIQFSETWGARTNNTWTGVMALLDEGKADFTICPMRSRTDRLTVLTYSPHVHVEKIRFLLRHPKRSSIRNIFFEPLDNTVWWCILALIGITTLLLFIHIRTEYQLYLQQQNQQLDASHKSEKHLDFIVLIILEAIFMQGPSPGLFRNNSTRLLLVSVSVFSVLLMQFYGAFIVSSLLSEPPRTLNNLDALYNSSFKIGMENISYNYEIFSSTNNQLARIIYKQRICNQQEQNILSLAQGVQRIAKGKFAFYLSVDQAYRLLKTLLSQTEFCELQEITFNSPFVTGLGMGKSTPYNKFITTAILKFRESSLLQYNAKRWEIDSIDCSAMRSNAEVEVDLVHFAPVLVFLGFAMLVAIWIFIVECLYKNMEMRLQHNSLLICQVKFWRLGKKQHTYIKKQTANGFN